MPSPLVMTVGAEWRRTAVDPESWKATAGERPGGEAEGFFVERGELRGYLKPSKADANVAGHPRAAHEKIAADLAFDLGLPVPPAVLVDGVACGGRTREAVVSLVLYPEIQKWAQATATTASTAVAHGVLRSTVTIWSGIIAFDAWLANSDRNNDTNLLIGTDIHSEQRVSEPIFCDFANCMIHSNWTGEGGRDVALPPMLPVMSDFYDRGSALATAERIAGFRVETIQEIVHRIPDPYLQPTHKAAIVTCLSERRSKVPSVIDAYSR
jgi:hypothetical protein